MSNPTSKNPTAVSAPQKGTEKPHVIPHGDDELHVPKGVSRGTFLFLVGMMIFLLVIWLVPGPMLGIAGGSKNPVLARVTLPSGASVEWRASDLMVEQRALMDAMSVDMFLGFQLGINANKPEPPELTRLIVLDRIAQDAGVEVTDSDLAEHIRGTLQFQRATDDDFIKSIQARGMNVAAIEGSIRTLLRVARFQQLVGFAGAVPDPKKIEEQWRKENVEFAFDYATLAPASLREEARKLLPDDAGLEAWFGGLEEGEKEEFKTDEKRTAVVALFRDAETTPATELLAQYPEKPPEGALPTPAEELAQQYYNRVYPQRFAKAREEDSTAPLEYFTFDEVKAPCLAEAGVYFALQRWIDALSQRKTNGETIDLAAEAEKLGLDAQAFGEPLTRAQ